MKQPVRKTYEDIRYSLQRSARSKTFSIYVERDGTITVRAPADARKDEIEKLLEKKRKWIYRSLADWEDRNASRKDREYVSGESFLYLGKNHTLRLVEKQVDPLAFDNDKFTLLRSRRRSAKKLFGDFYRAKCKEILPQRVALYSATLDVRPYQIRVRELGNRWASCSLSGNLNFHWKCVMAPLVTLDYIVVHELTHLLHRNHCSEFWDQIDKVMPDYRERKGWLEQHGASMDL